MNANAQEMTKEFLHDFQEHSFYSPTYCVYCMGFVSCQILIKPFSIHQPRVCLLSAVSRLFLWIPVLQLRKFLSQNFTNSWGCPWDIFIRFIYQVTINKQFCYYLKLFFISLVYSFVRELGHPNWYTGIKTLWIPRYYHIKKKKRLGSSLS